MPHLVDAPVELEGDAQAAPAKVRVITRVDIPAGGRESDPGVTSEHPGAQGFGAADIARFEEDLLRRATILTRRDMSRARDLVQDTFERAIRNIDRLLPGSNVRAWLYTILGNRFQDLCRSDRTRAAAPLEEHHAPAPEPEPAPRWAAVTTAQLMEALAELPPHQRATFEYREFKRLSYEEIGRIMGVPVATVGGRLNRARTRLREILSARLDLEETV